MLGAKIFCMQGKYPTLDAIPPPQSTYESILISNTSEFEGSLPPNPEK